MAKINSREKGKRGEREAAKELQRVLGIEARRGQQFSGGDDSPDVVHSLPKVHFEIKRTEKLQLRKALEQATQDAGDLCPVILHRWNKGPWLAIVPLEQLPTLAVSVYLQLLGNT